MLKNLKTFSKIISKHTLRAFLLKNKFSVSVFSRNILRIITY